MSIHNTLRLFIVVFLIVDSPCAQAGNYFAGNAVLTYGNLDVSAHEIGHAADDPTSVLWTGYSSLIGIGQEVEDANSTAASSGNASSELDGFGESGIDLSGNTYTGVDIDPEQKIDGPLSAGTNAKAVYAEGASIGTYDSHESASAATIFYVEGVNAPGPTLKSATLSAEWDNPHLTAVYEGDDLWLLTEPNGLNDHDEGTVVGSNTNPTQGAILFYATLPGGSTLDFRAHVNFTSEVPGVTSSGLTLTSYDQPMSAYVGGY